MVTLPFLNQKSLGLLIKYMSEPIHPVFDPELNAHVAIIHPLQNGIRVFVYINRFEHVAELDELFLYHFDKDNNCIEFAFGERLEDVEEQKYISYTTDPAIHCAPFTIQITHQLETAHLRDYRFTIFHEPLTNL